MRDALSRSVLPLALLLGAFATQACAAPVASGDPSIDPAPAADDVVGDDAQASGPAAALAGHAGTSRLDAPATTLAGTKATAPAELRIQGAKAGYDVLSYSFGISGDSPLGSKSGAAAAAPKATLSAVSISARRQPGAPALVDDLFAGSHLPHVELWLAGTATSKPVELLELDEVFVVQSSTSASGTVVDQYELRAVRTKLFQGGSNVTVDVSTNEVACNGACACGDQGDAILGPYEQTSSAKLAGKAVRVDAVSVGVSNEASDPATGIAAGKARLDGIALSAPMSNDTLCAFWDVARGAHTASARIGVASPYAGLKDSVTWDACLAAVTSVAISGSDGTPYASTTLDAGGLVRTDFALDASGKATSSTTGWSFLTNQPITTCADVAAH